MEPVLVKFAQAHGPYKPGDVLFVDPAEAAELLAAGVIEPPAAGGDE